MFPLLVREQTSVLRHRVSPYDVEFTQTHIPVKTSIQTGFETAYRGHDPTVQTPCILENSIGGAWADGDYIVVKHHECQSSVAFEWVFVVEVKNRKLFPFFEPPVPGYFAVMAVDLSVAFEPCVVLARGEFCPLEQVFAWQFGTLRPILHVVDNFVSDIVGDPNSF